MSRTLRRERKNDNKIINDGKQIHKCRCSWCISEDKKKSIDKFYQDLIKNYEDN